MSNQDNKRPIMVFNVNPPIFRETGSIWDKDLNNAIVGKTIKNFISNVIEITNFRKNITRWYRNQLNRQRVQFIVIDNVDLLTWMFGNESIFRNKDFTLPFFNLWSGWVRAEKTYEKLTVEQPKKKQKRNQPSVQYTLPQILYNEPKIKAKTIDVYDLKTNTFIPTTSFNGTLNKEMKEMSTPEEIIKYLRVYEKTIEQIHKKYKTKVKSLKEIIKKSNDKPDKELFKTVKSNGKTYDILVLSVKNKEFKSNVEEYMDIDKISTDWGNPTLETKLLKDPLVFTIPGIKSAPLKNVDEAIADFKKHQKTISNWTNFNTHFKFINHIRSLKGLVNRWDDQGNRSYVTLTGYADQIDKSFPYYNILNSFNMRVHHDATNDNSFQKRAEKNLVELLNIHMSTIYEQTLQKQHINNTNNLIRSFYYSTMMFDPILMKNFIIDNYGSKDVRITKGSNPTDFFAEELLVSRNLTVFYLMLVRISKQSALRTNKDVPLNFHNLFLNVFKRFRTYFKEDLFAVIVMSADEIGNLGKIRTVGKAWDTFKRNNMPPVVKFIENKTLRFNVHLAGVFEKLINFNKSTVIRVNHEQLESELRNIIPDHMDVTDIVHNYLLNVELIDLNDPTVLRDSLKRNYFSYRKQFPKILQLTGTLKKATDVEPKDYPNDKDTLIFGNGVASKEVEVEEKSIGATIDVNDDDSTDPFKLNQNSSRKQFFDIKMMSNIILQKMNNMENKKSNVKAFKLETTNRDRLISLKQKLKSINNVYDQKVKVTGNLNQKLDVLQFISFINQVRIMELILPSIYLKDGKVSNGDVEVKDEEKNENKDDKDDEGNVPMKESDDQKKAEQESSFKKPNEIDSDDMRDLYKELKSKKIYTFLSVGMLLYSRDVDVNFIYAICLELFKDPSAYAVTPKNHIFIILFLSSLILCLRQDQEINLDAGYKEFNTQSYKKLSYIMMFLELIKVNSVIATVKRKTLRMAGLNLRGAIMNTLERFNSYWNSLPVKDILYLNVPNMKWFTQTYFDLLMTSNANLVEDFEKRLKRMNNDMDLQTVLTSSIIKTKFKSQFISAFSRGGYASEMRLRLQQLYIGAIVFMDSIKHQMNQLKKTINNFKKNPSYILDEPKVLLNWITEIKIMPVVKTDTNLTLSLIHI